LTRSRTNFNTKNTLIWHTRTKPDISYQMSPTLQDQYQTLH
jgi:hypothetical protein